MKKFLALLLSLVMVLALVACGDKKDDTNTDDQDNNEVTDFKVGFIMLHDENSTYDLNFINAAKEACETLGVEYTIVTNVPEGQECYDKAAELADAGCNIIFADSFGHEDYMIQAAKDFPDVQFCHSTGTKAHTEGLSNYHNAFASIYEGRYLAGVAAGMKLNEMIENGEFTADEAKIGYVGAFTYAEVISGYTSFFLGARSVCPTATMEVTFTGSWYDETAEKSAEPETFTVTREQMEKMEGLAKSLADEQDKYLRLAAEYDNYRKRTAKEKENLYADAKIDTIKALLGVYDNLERGLAQYGDEESPHRKGLEMVFNQFKESLKKLGVETMDAAGKPFDPEKHNAVMHVEDENYGENTVVEVLQQGFTLGDKVLRFAIVKVAN
jgi:molecular chaperone GrpE (heat shock protein)/predicted small lipoprotein YifL